MGYEKDLISIIVPVFNVEKYLEDCITSVLNQTYDNWELILIDNGSTDNSGKMIDGYSAKDIRIKSVHVSINSVAEARKIGFLLSRGMYVSFLDSDDFLDKRFLEIMLGRICPSDYWIACDFYACDDHGNIRDAYKDYHNSLLRELNNADFLEYYFKSNEIWTTRMWGKLFRRNAITEKCFVDLKYSQDTAFLFKVLENCDTFSVIQDRLIFYRIREESACHSLRYNTNKTCIFKTIDIVESYVKRKFPNYFKEVNRRRYLAIINTYVETLSLQKNDINRSNGRKIAREELKKIELSYLTIGEKIRFWLLKYTPRFYDFLMIIRLNTQI